MIEIWVSTFFSICIKRLLDFGYIVYFAFYQYLHCMKYVNYSISNLPRVSHEVFGVPKKVVCVCSGAGSSAFWYTSCEVVVVPI